MNDIDLWKDFISGKEQAYAEIYRRYYPLLCSYGTHMIGDRELVVDTIQDLFVKLILNHASLRATNHVRTYLFCAFRHKLLDALQQIHLHEDIDQCDELFNIGDETIEKWFDNDKDDVDISTEKRLVRALSKLSSRQREIIYLYYVKEMSYREIATIMGINQQSSKNLLFRAIIKLKKTFLVMRTIFIFWILTRFCFVSFF